MRAVDFQPLPLILSPEPRALISGELALPPEFALDIGSSFPERVVLGTTIRGNFSTAPTAAFGEKSYAEQCATLATFLTQVNMHMHMRIAQKLYVCMLLLLSLLL